MSEKYGKLHVFQETCETQTLHLSIILLTIKEDVELIKQESMTTGLVLSQFTGPTLTPLASGQFSCVNAHEL